MSGKSTSLVINDHEVKTSSAVSKKIFVSRLGANTTEEDITTLFSRFGEVEQVVVDGYSAIVTFNEERVVKELEELGEIMLNSTKLFLARVLEEHPKSAAEDSPAPFYQAGLPVALAPYEYSNQEMSANIPSYQPSYPYPIWYQSSSTPSLQIPNYEAPVPCYGPVNQSNLPGTGVPFHHLNTASAQEHSVFSFDTLATQVPSHQNHKYKSSHTRGSSTGCCHVCTTPNTVHGVAPLPPQHHLQYPGEAGTGHQLQPLTPITPSLQTGYLLPPTPTPIILPPMTPTYYLPPTPAPSDMFYNSHGYTCPPPGHSQSNCFTHLKTDSGHVMEHNKATMNMQNMTFFTSPFKRFTKFEGTPTPGGFPFKPTSNKVRVHSDTINNSNWYKQGERWGHRSGGEVDQVRGGGGDVPDIVKDC